MTTQWNPSPNGDQATEADHRVNKHCPEFHQQTDKPKTQQKSISGKRYILQAKIMKNVIHY